MTTRPYIYLIGAGPGLGQWLTRAAWEALTSVEAIGYPPSLHGLYQELAGQVPGRWITLEPGESVGDAVHHLNHYARVAILIPETPSVSSWAKNIASYLQTKRIRFEVVSGVLGLTAALDVAGFYCPGDAFELSSLSTGPPVRVQFGPAGVVWSNQKPPFAAVRGIKSFQPSLVDSPEFLDPNETILLIQPQQLSGRVAWLEDRPLFGKTVLIFQSGTKGIRSLKWLRELGASPVRVSVSCLVDPPSFDRVDWVLSRIERYDWLILTSAETIQRFFARLRVLGLDIRRVRAKIAVVGPETRAQVQDLGLNVALMPSRGFSQEGLLEAFRGLAMTGQSVLMPGGQLNRSLLGDGLSEWGALVERLVMYHNQPVSLSERVHRMIQDGELAAAMFTASSQVEYVMAQLSEEEKNLIRTIPSFSIGPLTSRTMTRHGLTVRVESETPSVEALIRCMARELSK